MRSLPWKEKNSNFDSNKERENRCGKRATDLDWNREQREDTKLRKRQIELQMMGETKSGRRPREEENGSRRSKIRGGRRRAELNDVDRATTRRLLLGWVCCTGLLHWSGLKLFRATSPESKSPFENYRQLDPVWSGLSWPQVVPRPEGYQKQFRSTNGSNNHQSRAEKVRSSFGCSFVAWGRRARNQFRGKDEAESKRPSGSFFLNRCRTNTDNGRQAHARTTDDIGLKLCVCNRRIKT